MDDKKYICTRSSIHQDTADNWLLMIPSIELSSNAKIVYLCLKKIQDVNRRCQTDTHSWFKISGLLREDVDSSLIELERFGLIELYFSAKNLRKRVDVCCAYLLDHPLMKNRYREIDCPHPGDNVENPLSMSKKIKFHELLDYADEIREDYKLPSTTELRKDTYETHN